MASNVNNCYTTPYLAVETANDAVANGTMSQQGIIKIYPNEGYRVTAAHFNISNGTPSVVGSSITGTGNIFAQGDPGVNLPTSVKSVEIRDFGAPLAPDNYVEAIVTLADDYVFPAEDVVINIDINGEAVEGQMRYVDFTGRVTVPTNFKTPQVTLVTPDSPSAWGTFEHYNVSLMDTVDGNTYSWRVTGYVTNASCPILDFVVEPNTGYTININDHYMQSTGMVWGTGSGNPIAVASGLADVGVLPINPNGTGSMTIPSAVVDGNYTSYHYQAHLKGNGDIDTVDNTTLSIIWPESCAQENPLPTYAVTSIATMSGFNIVNNKLIVPPVETHIKLKSFGDNWSAYDYHVYKDGEVWNGNSGTIINTPPDTGGMQGILPITIPANTTAQTTPANFAYSITCLPTWVNNDPSTDLVTTFTNPENWTGGSHLNNFGEVVFDFLQVFGPTKVIIDRTTSDASMTITGNAVAQNGVAGTSSASTIPFTFNVSSSTNITHASDGSTGYKSVDLSNFTSLNSLTNGGSEIILANVHVLIPGVEGNPKTAKITGYVGVDKFGVGNVVATIDINDILND